MHSKVQFDIMFISKNAIIISAWVTALFITTSLSFPNISLIELKH